VDREGEDLRVLANGFQEKGPETRSQMAPKPDPRFLGAYQGEQQSGTKRRREKEGE